MLFKQLLFSKPKHYYSLYLTGKSGGLSQHHLIYYGCTPLEKANFDTVWNAQTTLVILSTATQSQGF
jgi:hypothetical protein